MNANDSWPARMAAAIPSIGSPARSQATARRIFWRSPTRNGAGPSRATRTPRAVMRPISASVTPARVARPAAVSASMAPSYGGVPGRGAAPARLGDQRPGGGPAGLVLLVAALLAQAQLQVQGLEHGRELGGLPAADPGGPLHDHGHPAQGPLVGGEPVGPRGLLEGAADGVQLVRGEPAAGDGQLGTGGHGAVPGDLVGDGDQHGRRAGLAGLAAVALPGRPAAALAHRR